MGVVNLPRYCRLFKMMMMMIYILWWSVCVSRKIITSYLLELSARGAKRDTRQALPAEGRLWPSDDDDDDGDGGRGKPASLLSLVHDWSLTDRQSSSSTVTQTSFSLNITSPSSTSPWKEVTIKVTRISIRQESDHCHFCKCWRDCMMMRLKFENRLLMELRNSIE